MFVQKGPAGVSGGAGYCLKIVKHDSHEVKTHTHSHYYVEKLTGEHLNFYFP